MKYALALICTLVYTPAVAQDASWDCRQNHRGPVCVDEKGEQWRGRFDNHDRRVWLNSHGDRVTEYKRARRTDLNVGNTTVAKRYITPTNREVFEYIDGRLLWCKTNAKGEKTCRQ